MPFCGPSNRSKDMTMQFLPILFSTRAVLSASVDLPFKESNDSGLREYIRLTSPCREG